MIVMLQLHTYLPPGLVTFTIFHFFSYLDSTDKFCYSHYKIKELIFVYKGIIWTSLGSERSDNRPNRPFSWTNRIDINYECGLKLMASKMYKLFVISTR